MPRYEAMCKLIIDTHDITVDSDEIGEALAEVIEVLDGGVDLAVNNPDYDEDEAAEADEDYDEEELIECEFEITHVGIVDGSIKRINNDTEETE